MKPFAFLSAALGLLPWLLPNLVRAEEPAPSAPAEVKRTLIDLEFPGGTVADYVQALLKAATGVNIVVMPEAAGFAVPPLTLTGVDVGSALELLHGRTERKGRGVVELAVHDVEPFQGQGRPIYTISSSIGPLEAERADEAGVWAISELLSAELKAQDVLTAIQTAMDLIADRYGPADIRFHEATGLVIARGHVQQMHTIEQVVKRLRESLRTPSKPDSHPDQILSALDALKNQNQSLLTRLAKAEELVVNLTAEKAALEARIANMPESPAGTEPK